MQCDLVGVYLHGSLAMGCYNPQKSDVDLLVVVKKQLTEDTKKKLIREILLLEEKYPSCRLEMSVILENEAKHPSYPTPFELHYSKEHKRNYEEDPNYSCSNEFDPDLIAHMMMTHYRGKLLYGKEIQQTFSAINKEDYIAACLQDVKDSRWKIREDLVYYTLNLCRLLYFLGEGIIASKREGGEWALKVLPSKYHNLVGTCLTVYNGQRTEMEIDKIEATNFSDYMLKQIDNRGKLN
ncbi:DNA polymerase [Virgibacillus sp. SK37]|nr:DNA polymerase [Virgibacillus sp. SK37]